MWAPPGAMLEKGHRVGSTNAQVVSGAWAVPLGINHNLQRVGGLCAPNGTSTPAAPNTTKWGVVWGHSSKATSRASLQLQKQTQEQLEAFMAALDGEKK